MSNEQKIDEIMVTVPKRDLAIELEALKVKLASMRKLLELVVPCVERDAAATEDPGARRTIASVARAMREELDS